MVPALTLATWCMASAFLFVPAAATPPATVTVVDWSRVGPSPEPRIFNLPKADACVSDKVATLRLDLSTSCLGERHALRLLANGGAVSVAVGAVRSREDRAVDAPVVVELLLRRGGITAAGAVTLLDFIAPPEAVVEEGPAAVVEDEVTWRLSALDLSFNDLAPVDGGRRGARTLAMGLRRLLAGEGALGTLRALNLESCNLTPYLCNALAKGLLRRARTEGCPSLRRLSLCGNPLGDAGAAALAAALCSSPPRTAPLVEILDLSACDLGDYGLAALGRALSKNPGCVGILELGHGGGVTDAGAAELAHALERGGRGNCRLALVLDGNKKVGDGAATAVARAVEAGAARKISLRDCGVGAEGAAALGGGLAAAAQGEDDDEITLDLSGNLIGTGRVGKAELKGKKYSAGELTRQATKTTTAYVNLLGKKIGVGLRDAGLDLPSLGTPSNSLAKSDNDFEAAADAFELERGGRSLSSDRCGARAFMTALEQAKIRSTPGVIHCHVGMRQCNLDPGGANALAAAVVVGRKRGLLLTFDVCDNAALDRRTVMALRGDEEEGGLLKEMAEQHEGNMKILQVAQVQAAKATQAQAVLPPQRMRKASGEWGTSDPDEEDDAFFADHSYDNAWNQSEYDDKEY